MSSASQKGGANGAGGEMRASILRQINSWAGNADWADPDRADRAFEKMNEAPELFITPNPETCGSYREEASRIYNKIKEEHGLLLKSDLSRERRTYEDKREQYLAETVREHIEQYGAENIRAVLNGDYEAAPEKCRRDVRSVIESESPDVYDRELTAAENLNPESGELPEPQIEEPEPEPQIEEPEPEPQIEEPEPAAGADAAAVRDAIESVDDRPDEPEPEQNGFSWVSFGSWIGRRVGREIGRTLRTIGLLAFVFLKWAIPAAGREGKRSAVIIARVFGLILGYFLRLATFTAGLAAAVAVAFGKGAVTGATA